MHLLQISRCIIFSNLRIKCRLESTHKLLDSCLNLNSNTSSCIDNRTEEDVQHHVKSLGI